MATSLRRVVGLLLVAVLTVVGSLGSASAASTTYVYRLKAVHSGKCLDVRGASLEDQALVQQFGCHTGGNQKWLIKETSDRSVIIRAKHSGKCLDVRNASLVDGALVQQFTCHGEANQRWWMFFGSDGTITLQSVYSGKCLQIRSASLADRAVAEQSTCRGASNQRFKGTLLGSF